MAVKNIKLGQVWRQDASGQDFLVTKVYSEVFTQYAVLRPAEVNAPNVPGIKVKVAKSADGVALAGLQLHAGGGVLDRVIRRSVIGRSKCDCAALGCDIHRKYKILS